MEHPISKPVLFISDLHLSAQRPGQLKCLAGLLRAIAARKAELYILGDLFEQFWIGTDDHSDVHAEVLALLAAFSTQQDSALYVLRGNRDFYLNDDFARQTGATLLEEPFRLQLGAQTTLLMHGDVLCTQDTRYQRYRRIVTTGAVERLFMSLPLVLRRAIVRGIRNMLLRNQQSRTHRPPPRIVDVEESAVMMCMRTHGVHTLIHGHTHRPAIHDFMLDGHPARRLVLGDWYELDSVLLWQEGDFSLLRVAECLERLA